jgi:ATP adenylyltransferase
MEPIWSPWRMNYIMNPERTADCIFCKALHETDGPENLVVYRGKAAFVMLNRFPYTSGHVMVIPYQHTPGLETLPGDARAELMELSNRAILVLRAIYGPEGFNLGANLGAAAGAGIADHLHLHVVPRWRGDTNFMATVAHARVLPERLEDTYTRILSGWHD